MTASADDAPPPEARDEGWDESVLVWNATVARIPAPAVQPNPAPDDDAAEGPMSPDNATGRHETDPSL